jgi:hypothetical protein
MSVLRWNFKANMEKMMSCDNGQITLVLFASKILTSSENHLCTSFFHVKLMHAMSTFLYYCILS